MALSDWWNRLVGVVTSKPAAETLEDKLARPGIVTHGSESGTSTIHISGLNLGDRQRLFAGLPKEYRPKYFGGDQIEIPDRTREQTMQLIAENFGGASPPAPSMPRTRQRGFHMKHSASAFDPELLERSANGDINLENPDSTPPAPQSETTTLRIAPIRSNEGEVVGVAPSVGGEAVQETFEARAARTSGTVDHALPDATPPTTAIAEAAPAVEAAAEHAVRTKHSAKMDIGKSLRRTWSSFVDRFSASEEAAARSAWNNEFAMAMVGVSAVVALGAALSANDYDREIKDAEDRLHKKFPTDSWAAKLDAEGPPAALPPFRG
ncbi:MAG: hypothetical protein SFX19_06360 [Alphaproteobacteria bacterium]|nr:hypothetical protein [Alphaproteobacteria bacterium]